MDQSVDVTIDLDRFRVEVRPIERRSVPVTDFLRLLHLR